jgi:hypothetical protein
LGDEEWRSAQGSTTVLVVLDLVVEELLNVFDGEKVFTVHRNDHGVPDL